MSNQKITLNNLENLFNENDYHVFFLINPIVEILIFLWIKTFDIPESRIIIIKLRDNEPAIINLKTYCFTRTITDRIFYRMGVDSFNKKLENFIKNKSIKFYLYSSWVHPEFDTLLRTPNCLGHFYLEEGQLSHRKRKFIEDQKLHINAIKKLKKYAENLDNYHRQDAMYFIAIDPKAFPHIAKEKKILFKDLSSIKKIYKPFLLGKKYIGIGPAPRRLKKTTLINCLVLIANSMPDYSIIKLHPGYNLDKKKLNYLKIKIKEKANKNIEFCDQRILLELEMLYEEKIFYGDKSSLIRYSELFNSNYNIINLYQN